MSIDLKAIQQFTAAPKALADQVILVTGASNGIGRALSKRCAELGARVILLGRKQKELEKLYDEIVESGAAEPVIVALDFLKADGGSYMSLAERIREDFGRLDALVHCAGMLGEVTTLEEYDALLWQQVIHVNLTAGFALSKVCVPLLRESKGALIFTTSSVGRKGRAFWGAYAVSKFGVEGLAQTFADELKSANVRVNVVNPGATKTDMRLQAYPAEDRSKLKTPEEVLGAYLYFLCDDKSGETGQSIDAQ